MKADTGKDLAVYPEGQCWVQYCLMSSWSTWVYPQSADDTKLAGVADALEGQVAIQTDLNKIEKWADGSFTKFNKVLYLGDNTTMHQHSADQLESVIFARTATKHWNGLLREVMESLSLETFKNHLSMVLGSLF